MLYDTSLNNRGKWINEIKYYTNETETSNVIQYALSYTLQALRVGEENRYKWDGDCL